MTPKAISPFFVTYLALWISFCLIALYIAVADREFVWRQGRHYLAFLAVPWKVAVFIAAFIFVTVAGRFTDDETWDGVTGSGMSILTFLTAPWSVGVIYKVHVGRRPARFMIVAMALLLFSSSWFYDAYLLWRDGAYSARWLGNLMLSPIIYVAAGLFWNLEAKNEWELGDHRSYRFSFLRADWPKPPLDTRFAPLIFPSLPYLLVAAFVLVGFVGWRFHFLEH